MMKLYTNNILHIEPTNISSSIGGHYASNLTSCLITIPDADNSNEIVDI